MNPLIMPRMAHNELVIRNAENAINSLIDMVQREGGFCCIQAESNPEHHYNLTEHISISYFVPVKSIRKDDYEWMESKTNAKSEI